MKDTRAREIQGGACLRSVRIVLNVAASEHAGSPSLFLGSDPTPEESIPCLVAHELCFGVRDVVSPALDRRTAYM